MPQAGNGTRTNSVVSGNGCSGSVINNIFTLSPGASGSIQSLTGSYGGYGSVLHVGDVIQFADSRDGDSYRCIKSYRVSSFFSNNLITKFYYLGNITSRITSRNS